MKRSTAEQLAKKLGVSRATIFNFRKQYPTEAPESFDDFEGWRLFVLAHAVDPQLICRLDGGIDSGSHREVHSS
jgi:hypothetical protein